MQIKVDKLSFRYADTISALENVSFDITAGECVALAGHNGSGKSTLVKHLNGLLQPVTGKIIIDGNDTSTESVARLAGKVALLFQNPDDQICKQSVWEEVAFGPKNLGYPARRIDSLVNMSLSLFDVLDVRAKNPYDLGYSERKRVAMASIVAMDTPVIVFDEPTAGLDSYEIALLINALHILKNNNKTVIIISHDVDFVAENCTRAICLAGGRKVFDGDVRELFSSPTLLKSCGLLPPQVVQLSNHFDMTHSALSPDEFIEAF